MEIYFLQNVKLRIELKSKVMQRIFCFCFILIKNNFFLFFIKDFNFRDLFILQDKKIDGQT